MQDGSPSITKLSAETTMQAAFSSVNRGLKPEPGAVKNPIDRSGPFTARLTKILRDMHGFAWDGGKLFNLRGTDRSS